MAVPMTVKMPEPMTAPMPRAVRDQGPSVFLSAWPGSSDSRISLSMDLRATSWLGRAALLCIRTLSDAVRGTCSKIAEERSDEKEEKSSRQQSALSRQL